MPEDAGNSQYITCSCGSTIKQSGFGRHFYTAKHIDYLIPILEREWNAEEAQQEERRCLQRAAAVARAEAKAAEALARATSAESDMSEAE